MNFSSDKSPSYFDADTERSRPVPTLRQRIGGAIRYHGRFGYESFFLILAPVLLLLTGLLLWWLFGSDLHSSH